MRLMVWLGWLVVLVASAPARGDSRGDPFVKEKAAPGSDPLAVLREQGNAWVYELVQGDSFDQLAPTVGGRARCELSAWQPAAPTGRPRPGMAGAQIDCRLLATPGTPVATTTAPVLTIWLVFDGAGVRQLAGPDADPSDRSRSRGLTFPAQLSGPWKLDEKGKDGAGAQGTVREETRPVLGKPQQVWISDVTYWERAGDPPARDIVVFAPDLGPVLVCTVPASTTLHWCLRLTEAPRLVGKPRLASKPPEGKPPEGKPPGGKPGGKPGVAPVEPSPATGGVSIASAQAHDPSSLTADLVATRIRAAYLSALRGCYRDAKSPALRGTLRLDFTVNAVGKIEIVTAKGVDPLVKCVQRAASMWTFPIPLSTYKEPRNARFTVSLAVGQ